MRCLGVEVGCDIVGACKCVAAYLSNRISVGSSSSVRSKLHNAKTVRLAAIILFGRHDNVLVPLALDVFGFGAPTRLRPGNLILPHGMSKADQAQSATGDRSTEVLSSPSFLEELWYLSRLCGGPTTNLNTRCVGLVARSSNK